MEYDFFADFLNKFSQLTPWVQAVIGLGMCAVVLGIAYFVKEIVAVVMSPFKKFDAETEPKKEWRDKYYRGDESDKRVKGCKATEYTNI